MTAAAAAKQEDQEEVPRSLGSGLSRNSCSSSCKMTATAARLQDSDRHHQVSRECSTHHRIHSTYVDYCKRSVLHYELKTWILLGRNDIFWTFFVLGVASFTLFFCRCLMVLLVLTELAQSPR